MKRLLFPSILILSGLTASASLIVNGDFETNPSGFSTDPETATPNWLWDGDRSAPGTANTGTEATIGYYAVSRSSQTGSWGGAIYQTTSEIIGDGTLYSMTANTFNTWNPHGGELIGRLYYLDGETRVYITGAEASYSGESNDERPTPSSTMQIDYTGSGAAVGKLLGVEFEWAGASGEAGSPDHNGSWQGIDNVAINLVSDPNILAPSSVSFGSVSEDEGPHTSIMTVSNSGASNTLTISAGTFGGTNPDAFSLADGIFPLEIAAGGSADIEVTFAPGSELGFYSATLDLESNDQNKSMISVAVEATLVYWQELIINGDFEKGDLTGWDDDNEFNWVGTPTHTGTGAAEYTLDGGNQWGEAQLDTTSPPATADDSTLLEVTEEMWGKNYKYTAWYFRPATGGMAEDDEVMFFLRWNGSGSDFTIMGKLTVGDIPVDTWVQVTGEGVMPYENKGEPLVSIQPFLSFNDVEPDEVGGDVMYVDDVSFKIESLPPPPKIKVTEVSKDGGSITISWESEAGLFYRFLSETDLNASNPESWPTYTPPGETEPLDRIAATPPINTETFLIDPESNRFFVVDQYDPPPVRIYFDDFEMGQGDWVVDNTTSGAPATLWELGAPDDTLVGGPAAARSGTNCFGTNLAAYTGHNALIFLVSPEVDLTSKTEATLSFAHFRQIETDFDFGSVRILDADNGDAELAILEVVIDGIAGWQTYSKELPAEALGKNVKFEFAYTSDELNEADFAGWYLDDVAVTEPVEGSEP